MTRREFFNLAFDALVEHMGVRPSLREDFVAFHHDNPKTRPGYEDHTEFRVEGSVGFGGKFRTRPSWREGVPLFYVNCYLDDENARVVKAIEATNSALDTLYRAHWSAVKE